MISPRSESCKKDNSERARAMPKLPTAAATSNNGNGSGSGTEKDQRSSGSAGGKSGKTRTRSARVPILTSSSSEDEYENSSQKKLASRSSRSRKNSRELLDFRSSTNPRPRKNHSPKNRYKSSENILEKVSKSKQGNLSEGELLEDKTSIFDFTSNRNKNSASKAFDYLLNKTSPKKDDSNMHQVELQQEPPVMVESHEEAKKNDSNSDKSHEPFGSTEFPTLKRNMKISTAQCNVLKPNQYYFDPFYSCVKLAKRLGHETLHCAQFVVAENEYESMTSIRNSVWTPTDTAGPGKTIDGLSSPSVIVQDGQDAKADLAATDDTTPIEPPPNFTSPSPKDCSSKSKIYSIKPNKHEAQFQATLQRATSASSNNKSPKQDGNKSSSEQSNHSKVLIQPHQVRMASLQAAQEIRQRQTRSKRIRNRSLEMVLDENRSSDSSPSRKRWLIKAGKMAKTFWFLTTNLF